MQRSLFAAGAAAAFAAASAFAISFSPAAAKEHNVYNCVNPAGHVRGWCKHAYARGIAGRVVSISGVLVTLARKNGRLVRLNQQPLLARGAGLLPGRYYTLQGYNSNGVFVATAITSWAY